jgi:hypothetical protein
MYSKELKTWYLKIHRLRWKDNIKMYLKDIRTCKVIHTEGMLPKHLSKRAKTDTHSLLCWIVILYQEYGEYTTYM